MEKKTKLLITKIIFAFGSVGLSIFLIFQVFSWMGNRLQEKNKNLHAKIQVDMARTTQEAQRRQMVIQGQKNQYQAQAERQKQATEEQARKMEVERFKREIAENQTQESKKAEFEKQFKPREECNDPMLEWSKVVQCKNERMTAKEAFYKKH